MIGIKGIEFHGRVTVFDGVPALHVIRHDGDFIVFRDMECNLRHFDRRIGMTLSLEDSKLKSKSIRQKRGAYERKFR